DLQADACGAGAGLLGFARVDGIRNAPDHRGPQVARGGVRLRSQSAPAGGAVDRVTAPPAPPTAGRAAGRGRRERAGRSWPTWGCRGSGFPVVFGVPAAAGSASWVAGRRARRRRQSARVDSVPTTRGPLAGRLDAYIESCTVAPARPGIRWKVA